MDFFARYSSGTAAGSGNQSYFCPADPSEMNTGRVFYRLSYTGVFQYSILMSNITDSTYADGSHSACNRICDSWTIHSLKTAVCKDIIHDGISFTPVTFDGKTVKQVNPGEIFCSDAFTITATAGDYLCIETAFSGKMIPNHPESIIPSFRNTADGFVPSKELPFISMLGCNKTSSTRIAFWGDSITQGIGTPDNSYTHYAALLSEKLPDCSVWDLGLGYGRAHDAASDGAWMFKARQNDIVCVCYGVNDLLQLHDPDKLQHDLYTIVTKLKSYGCAVLLQTVPPFDYDDATVSMWKQVNTYILNDLSHIADVVFDNVPILSVDSEHPHLSQYGPHPNSEGHKAWADALFPVLKKTVSKRSEIHDHT